MSTSMAHSSGTLFGASPPMIRPRLTDGRSKSSEDSRVNGIDSIRRKTSIAFRTALSPSHGVEPCAEVPKTMIRSASTPLAWTPTCRFGRLAGDREIADVARLDQQVRRALVDLLGLLVGHADEAHRARRSWSREVVQRAHHRREAALHVIGAAALEPVALDPRGELLRPRRDDVVVPVEDERRAFRRADLRGQREDVAVLVVVDGDVARLEPALDEARRTRADPRRWTCRT